MRSIGKTAAATGVKVATIRYYEQVGLVTAARNAGNQRLYDDDAVRRLKFIAHARQLGFGLREIAELLSFADQPEQSCEQVDRIARRRLADVNDRIKRLRALQKELKNMIGACASGQVADCRIIETLADHRKCLSKEH